MIAYSTIILEGYAGFIRVRSLDKYELVLPDFVEDSLLMCVNTLAKDVEDLAKGTYHVIPSGDDAFHIQVAGEERHDPVRYNFAVFNEDAPEISYNCRIVTDFKT